MIKESLKEFLRNRKQFIDECLPAHIEKLNAPNSLKEAMLYSIDAGGKRVRPILLLATLQGLNKDEKLGLDVACAVEMIHTYSLIHDDLPAMDDDDLRRGKPTNHKVYGEALAILAGDALLTYSFELIASMTDISISPEQKLELIKLLAKASGPEGMVGGQVADMEGEEKSLSLHELEYVHQHKTGDLLTFSVEAGAVLANASVQTREALLGFSKHLGLVFQIKDDILDIEGDETAIGKPVGSDESNHKSTYPSLLSLQGAKEKLMEHKMLAKEYLYKVNLQDSLLDNLTDYIADRNH